MATLCWRRNPRWRVRKVRKFILLVPFSPTFAGTDAFTYSMIDSVGAEGPPGLVTLTISADSAVS